MTLTICVDKGDKLWLGESFEIGDNKISDEGCRQGCKVKGRKKSSGRIGCGLWENPDFKLYSFVVVGRFVGT